MKLKAQKYHIPARKNDVVERKARKSTEEQGILIFRERKYLKKVKT